MDIIDRTYAFNPKSHFAKSILLAHEWGEQWKGAERAWAPSSPLSSPCEASQHTAESQVIYCLLHTNSWLTSCRFARSVTFSEKYLTPTCTLYILLAGRLSHTLLCFIYFLLICDARRDTEEALLDCFHTSSLSLYQRAGAGLFILLMMALLFLFLVGMCFSYRNRAEWKIPVCRDLLSIHAVPGLHSPHYTLLYQWKMRPFIVFFAAAWII